MTHPSEEIISFWLEEAGPEKWYAGGEEFDTLIRDRFMEMWEEARRGLYDGWTSHPRKALALIILLDQFPRNMFRGDAMAFETDSKAKAAACTALSRGWDERFPQNVRQFFYMPFMHSEALTDQDHSVRLTCQKMPDEREDKLPMPARIGKSSAAMAVSPIATRRLDGTAPMRKRNSSTRAVMARSWKKSARP